jgi:glycosyltransferase involved in cell wall biosynthesis
MVSAVESTEKVNDRLRIACIVSFLNEERHLGRFFASMAAQQRFPDQLVLVDDGSNDASPKLAAEFAATRDDVLSLTRPSRPSQRDRLAQAAELRSFLWATTQLDQPWEVLVKMDADLELSADLFATLERAFLEDPALGLAGTYLSLIDEQTGTPTRERCPAQHVRGANKFYRRSCFERISPIAPILGWDTIDEISARMHGWQTMSLSCPQGDTLHLRPTGRVDGRLRAQYRWGICAYGIGQHPAWVLCSAARRVRDRPRLLGSCAFLFGWVSSAMRRLPRATGDVRAYGRREQLAELRCRARAEGRKRLRSIPGTGQP